MMIRTLARSVAGALSSRITRVARALRYAYNFDGVDDYAALTVRAINPDGDIDIEFTTGKTITLGTSRAIVSQNISNNGTAHEFVIFMTASGSLLYRLGGATAAIAVTLQPKQRYRIRLVGTSLQTFTNDALSASQTFARGTAREPTALTAIGASANGAGGFAYFWADQLFDVKINGVHYAMDNPKAGLQLPTPRNLGAELLTAIDFIPANAATGGTTVAGKEWFVTRTGAQLYSDGIRSLKAGGGPTSVIPGMTYLFEIESDRPVNLAAYTGTFVLVATKSSSNQLLVTAPTDKLILYVVPVEQNQRVNVKNATLRPLWTEDAAQLVTNGDFTDSAGWSTQGSASLSVSGGQATLTTVASQSGRAERGVVLEAGGYYVVSADLVSLTVTSARLSLIRGAAGSYQRIGIMQLNAAGRFVFIVRSPATDALIQVLGDDTNAGTVVFDNVSVKKVTSLCNPMQMVNCTSDRWQEVPL